MKTQLLKRALLLLLTLCVCGTLSAQEAQLFKNLVSIKLIDASTKRIIANTAVEVRSNNGIICKRAPCPNNSLTWKGVSGADGLARIPSCVIQYSTTLIVADYEATELNKTMAEIADSILVVELAPDTSTAPQRMTTDVPPPSLPARAGAWLVRLDVRHGRDGMKRNSWVMTSGSEIAATNTAGGGNWQETFPCRAKLSAEGLRWVEGVLAAVKPSAWLLQYGTPIPDVGSRSLRLVRREADGAVHTYVVIIYPRAEEQPQDLQALHAAVQAVAKQAFAGQSCGSSPLLGSLNDFAPTAQSYFITTLTTRRNAFRRKE